jgi:hypothetical protein
MLSGAFTFLKGECPPGFSRPNNVLLWPLLRKAGKYSLLPRNNSPNKTNIAHDFGGYQAEIP